jgi:photosystem II stability/assembly factor-like uncharacterized protein
MVTITKTIRLLMTTKALAPMVLCLISVHLLGQTTPKYKTMMRDLSVNYHDVVNEADAYFKTIDITKKGTGYKEYQRWKADNKGYFHPTGERNRYNPNLAFEACTRIKNESDLHQRTLFPQGWVNYGPSSIYPMANTSTFGHGLGRVEDFWVNPTDPNLIYASSRSGGFYKSLDGGLNFVGSTTGNLPSAGVRTFGVKPTNPNEILVSSANGSNEYSHGIYKSLDGGDTWSATTFIPGTSGFGGLASGFYIYEIVFHPLSPSVVFAGTSEGIFRSNDNFATWAQIAPTQDVTDIEFHPTNANIIYAYDANTPNLNRIFKSTNGGTSFVAAGTLPNNNNDDNPLISTSNDCPNCVFVASHTGIWKSIDEGNTFVFKSDPPGTSFGFAVSKIDTSKMILGYEALYKTSDGGSTWSMSAVSDLPSSNGTGTGLNKFLTSTNYIHADLRNLRYINGAFYAATDGMLAKSTDDGLTWTKMYNGMGIREARLFGISQSNNKFSVIGSQDCGTSIFSENEWIKIAGGDGNESFVHPLNPNYIIMSYPYAVRNRIVSSTFSTGPANPSGSQTGAFDAPLAFASNNPMKYYDFRKSVYRSQDFGLSFDLLATPATIGGDNIDEAEVAQNNNDIIIVATGSAIEKSTNGGVSFASIKNNLPSISISDICFDPKNDDLIMVTGDNGTSNSNNKVFISTNGGSSWTNVTYNLTNMPIHSIIIDHTPQKNIYIGAEIGIFTKPMNGTTWTLYNTNLQNVKVSELDINYGANTIKAASKGNGLLENHLVGRATYPAIVNSSITNNPTLTLPKVSMLQDVTSKIHYVGTLTSVFVKYSTTLPTFNQTLQMAHISDTTWRSVSPLPDYPVGTRVFFKVYAVGSNQDTSETYRFTYDLKPFEYCVASGDAANPYISNVNIQPNNILVDNNTINDYSLYPDTIYLKKMNTYTMNIANVGGSSQNDNAAWLDVNHDGEYSADELILYKTNTGAAATQNFLIPSTAIEGVATRMRIRLTTSSANLVSCGTYVGDVQDYHIIQYECGTVVNTKDSGNGSLREAIDCAMSGDTIRLHSLLANKSIRISTSPLVINKNLVILGQQSQNITISSVIPQVPTVSSIFNISVGQNVIFKNFKIDGGYGPEGNAIINSGNLTLANMDITNGGNTNAISVVKNQNSGTVKIEQLVKITD